MLFWNLPSTLFYLNFLKFAIKSLLMKVLRILDFLPCTTQSESTNLPPNPVNVSGYNMSQHMPQEAQQKAHRITLGIRWSSLSVQLEESWVRSRSAKMDWGISVSTSQTWSNMSQLCAVPFNAGNWCWSASGRAFLFSMETAVGILCPGFNLPVKKTMLRN